MSDSCKRPLDNNDDLPPTASDAGSNTKKARRSSDPAATEDENQEPHSPNQDVIDKGKQKATSEPRTINPQDPFDLFDAGIVRMIIAELDAPDTETLRRVSKLWKASSEFHCGRTMLRQHFPEAAANLSEDEPGSCEEENLRFRRYCKFIFWTTMARETAATRLGETNPFACSVSSAELPARICHKSLQIYEGKHLGFKK